MFDRTKPCKTCPFRTDENALRYLGEKRAQEIVDSLLGDKSFTCHDDIDLDDKKKQHCVGATIILEKTNNPNQMMRICERLRLYDRHALSGHDEIFDDFDDWVECQATEYS